MDALMILAAVGYLALSGWIVYASLFGKA